jgi:hypothetical protein
MLNQHHNTIYIYIKSNKSNNNNNIIIIIIIIIIVSIFIGYILVKTKTYFVMVAF